MNVLYVASGGRVRRGHLTTERAESSYGQPVLVAGGEVVPPADVLALLSPPQPTEDERAVLWRAIEAGYRVEDA
jgi:hypothetical protein